MFFSRVFKASNVSRNFNRPFSPIFELEEKKQKELNCREEIFLKNNKRRTELKNIFDYNFANVSIYTRAQKTRARRTRARIVVVVSV